MHRSGDYASGNFCRLFIAASSRAAFVAKKRVNATAEPSIKSGQTPGDARRPVSVMPLASDRASVLPATRLLRFNAKSVAPCRRPVTRPVTTKRISVRVSSLACARSSHRANKNCRESAPAAAAARAEPKPHGIPAATPKRFFPFTL
jgi:hypothetical protein